MKFIPDDSHEMEDIKNQVLAQLGLKKIPDILVLWLAGFGATTDLLFEKDLHNHGSNEADSRRRLLAYIKAGDWVASSEILHGSASTRYANAVYSALHYNNPTGLLEWVSIVQLASEDMKSQISGIKTPANDDRYYFFRNDI